MWPWLENLLVMLERWAEAVTVNIKLVDQALSGMEGSYVELLTLLAIGLLAALPVLVPEKHRQAFRRLNQLFGIVVFIFVIYTCMGVFGMVRNLFRGFSEIGHENILALYFCSVPVTIIATSMIFGPLFCGWICPTGALQEFAALLVPIGVRKRQAAGGKGLLDGLAAFPRIAGPDGGRIAAPDPHACVLRRRLEHLLGGDSAYSPIHPAVAESGLG